MIRLKKRTIFLISAVILSLIFLAQPFFIAPFKLLVVDIFKFPLKLTSKISNSVKSLFSCGSCLKENESLRKDLGSIKSDILKLEETLKENERLKKLLSYKKRSNLKLITVPVIGRDPSNWKSNIIIGGGKKLGISTDAAVIADGGLFGKVVEVGSLSSRVLLINDINIGIASLVQRNREEGIVAGTLDGRCRMSYLSLSSDISISDKVITSGLGGLLPKSILIGEVEEIFEDPNGLMRFCLIKPTADLSKLEDVLVVIK